MRKWRQENPDYFFYRGGYRSGKARAKWCNTFFIDEAYRLAELRSALTGFRWEVHHIVPLRHPLVCGLHVESNLAVIPMVDNRCQGNRAWPDMP